jgi:hypothetical protein
MNDAMNLVHFFRRLSCITIVSFFLLPYAHAQLGSTAQQQQPGAPPIYQGQTDQNRQEDEWEAQQRKAMAKKYNLQRQQDIKKDTEKLLELATELKQAVDKSDENTLSMDVVKKAEQIEKLAKSVKEKMKGP